MVVRHLADEPFAAFSAGHAYRRASFVDEYKTPRIKLRHTIGWNPRFNGFGRCSKGKIALAVRARRTIE